MTGVIANLVVTRGSKYGFIRGVDGLQYFFIPSYLSPPLCFDALLQGQPVEFAPFEDARGFRAGHITVTSDRAVVPDGESHNQQG